MGSDVIVAVDLYVRVKVIVEVKVKIPDRRPSAWIQVSSPVGGRSGALPSAPPEQRRLAPSIPNIRNIGGALEEAADLVQFASTGTDRNRHRNI